MVLDHCVGLDVGDVNSSILCTAAVLAHFFLAQAIATYRLGTNLNGIETFEVSHRLVLFPIGPATCSANEERQGGGVGGPGAVVVLQSLIASSGCPQC